MQYDQRKLEWLEFDQMEPYPHVIHGVFTRHGGVSTGGFATLNVSDSVGDHPDSVKVNRERIIEAFDAKQLMIPHQNHGVNIVRITGHNQHLVHQADALFTTEKNLALGVTHADCQAAIFYDPIHEAIAVAHAGWRGSVQNIFGKVITILRQEIKSNPNDLLVCISPSLGPCHAEFTNYKQELPKEFWPYMVKPHYFDFWAISKMQLMQAGIPDKNIEIAGICTYCQKEDYFSHRRDPKGGRNATVAMLRGE